MYDLPPEALPARGQRFDPEANQIHPTVVIEGDVRMGKGNRILPYSVLVGPLEIGNDNVIGPHAVLGTEPQNTRDRWQPSAGRVVIGSRNVIREFSAVHKPVLAAETRIGDRCYLMQNTHVAHDSLLEDDVTLTTLSGIAGHTVMLRGANMAAGATSHQHSVMGQFSMVGMGAQLQKNLPPFARYVPRSPLSVNEYAIEKFGFEEYAQEIREYVLRRARPTSPALLALIEAFERHHLASGRASL
jgi:UDP-N-acetylglucosamine acyltransferase